MANNSEQARGGGVMTFEAIAAELCIDRSTAQAHFESGMRKLRSRRQTPLFQNLKVLAATLAQSKDERAA
jgi:DNA-binding CsgD family transcriptional regulator